MIINYSIDRSYNCLKIDTNNWLQNQNSLKKYRMSGTSVITNITSIVDRNIDSKLIEVNRVLQVNSVILLPHVCCEVARLRSYQIGNRNFYDVPINQVAGYFSEGVIDIEHLNLLQDNVLIKKINMDKNKLLYSVNDNSTVGEVLKVGYDEFEFEGSRKPKYVSVGDLVLVQDNVSTEVLIDGESYLVLSEDSIIGTFPSKERMNIEELEAINNSILLTEYKSKFLFESSFLESPIIDYNTLDYADTYNQDLFTVVAVDENLQDIQKNDIIFTDRDLTFYVYFKKQKYFLVKGMQSISAKLIKRG